MLFRFILLSWICLSLLACQSAKPVFQCTDKIGCVTLKPQEALKIGVLQDMTGGTAPFGKEQARVMEIVVERYNNQLLGHPIELIEHDTQCTPEGGANAALKILADPQVVAIFGTACSASGTAVSKAMSQAGLTMISGANSASSLTSVAGKAGADWHEGYFRTTFNGTTQNYASAAIILKELGLKKVATVDDGDAYTKGATESFRQAFTELGGQIVLDATFNKGDTDMKPVLTAVAKSQAELVFLVAFQPDGALFMQQSKEVKGLEKTLFFNPSTLLIKGFLEQANKDAIGMYFIFASPVKNKASQTLAATYEKKYDEPVSTASYVFAYDAADILFKAIEKVALKDDDGTLHIGRQALREAMYQTKDFVGISGKLTCDSFGDCASVKYDVARLDDPSQTVEEIKAKVIYTYAPVFGK